MVGDVSPDIHFKNIPTTASGPVAGGHTDCHWTWPGHTDGRQNQTFHPSGGGDCARCGRCIGGGAVAGKNHAWPDYSTGIRVGEPRPSAFHSWRFRLWRRYGYLLVGRRGSLEILAHAPARARNRENMSRRREPPVSQLLAPDNKRPRVSASHFYLRHGLPDQHAGGVRGGRRAVRIHEAAGLSGGRGRGRRDRHPPVPREQGSQLMTMLAVTVGPPTPNSGALEKVPEPDPAEGSILCETIAVGVDGTDNEIVQGKYGEAPPGRDRLILGHESLGRVLEAPAASGFTPGELVVGFVRRPDPEPCDSCAAGEWDMCRNGMYTERGIKGRHGFLSERFRIE